MRCSIYIEVFQCIGSNSNAAYSWSAYDFDTAVFKCINSYKKNQNKALSI